MRKPPPVEFQFKAKPRNEPQDWSISLLCAGLLFELLQLMIFGWALGLGHPWRHAFAARVNDVKFLRLRGVISHAMG